jgi:hypothetical protein
MFRPAISSGARRNVTIAPLQGLAAAASRRLSLSLAASGLSHTHECAYPRREAAAAKPGRHILLHDRNLELLPDFKKGCLRP